MVVCGFPQLCFLNLYIQYERSCYSGKEEMMSLCFEYIMNEFNCLLYLRVFSVYVGQESQDLIHRNPLTNVVKVNSLHTFITVQLIQ